MSHPEYLHNEWNEQDFVLVTPEINSPAAALSFLVDMLGPMPDELAFEDRPIWLRAEPIPPGDPEAEEAELWYAPTTEDDPEAVAYWRTIV